MLTNKRMWSLFIFFLYLITFTLIFKIVKGKLTRYLLYAHISYWLLSMSLSLLNPYGLYAVSLKTYLVVLLGTYSYILGYILIPSTEGDNRDYSIFMNNIRKQVERLHSSKIWLVFCLILLAFIIYVFSLYKDAILLYTASDVARNFDLVIGSDSIIYSLYRFIIPVFSTIVTFLLAYTILYNKNFLYATIYLMILIAKSAIGGSRASIFTIVIYFIVLFICNFLFSKEFVKRLKLKSICLYSSIIIIVYLFTGYLSYLRSLNDIRSSTKFSVENLISGCDKFNKELVVYVVGAYRALDYGIVNKYTESSGGYKYGRATLMGFERFISMFSSLLGYPIQSVYNLTVDRQQEHVINIGSSTKYGQTGFNYAYTHYMIFYYDFGIFGVIFFSILFGLTTKLVLNRFIKRKSLFSAMLFFYFFYIVLRVGFQWTFINASPYIFIILMLLVDRKYVVNIKTQYS